jgi:dihydrofolate reductase
MICGGAPIYKAFLPHANRLYLTQIHATFEGDVYFPEFDITAWEEVKRIDGEPDEKNPYPYSFLFLERRRG